MPFNLLVFSQQSPLKWLSLEIRRVCQAVYNTCFFNQCNTLIEEPLKQNFLLLHCSFADFEMEDTFHSWFLIVELHVWMLSVRVMRDEEYGRVVRDGLISTMWSDVDERSQHMTVSLLFIILTNL